MGLRAVLESQKAELLEAYERDEHAALSRGPRESLLRTWCCMLGAWNPAPVETELIVVNGSLITNS